MKQVDHRLAIAQGHMKKVRKMAENHEYCIDVLQQSLAVQSALKKVDEMLLKNHLATCVATAMKSGNKSKAIDEVVEIFEKGRR